MNSSAITTDFEQFRRRGTLFDRKKIYRVFVLQLLAAEWCLLSYDLRRLLKNIWENFNFSQFSYMYIHWFIFLVLWDVFGCQRRNVVVPVIEHKFQQEKYLVRKEDLTNPRPCIENLVELEFIVSFLGTFRLPPVLFW